jgi:hypothetical protein
MLKGIREIYSVHVCFEKSMAVHLKIDSLGHYFLGTPQYFWLELVHQQVKFYVSLS